MEREASVIYRQRLYIKTGERGSGEEGPAEEMDPSLLNRAEPIFPQQTGIFPSLGEASEVETCIKRGLLTST